ncbi:LysR family transcriptional regulator [Marinomonas shanghaiensis]|uniref:LysR family transcriptional regulator n=1 Tax=Marinomonas shanghaiensis TaxID=2202418 RepID=UPI0018E59E5F|nr:LysR family transcriptional regulator [Marinomonas shanghaiensis]
MSKNIDIVTLRSFSAVVEHGGVSKAAKALYLTQSAISQHIKRLESMLDTTLFSRAGRGLVLTPTGEMLLEYASKILLTNDAIINHFRKEVEKNYISIGLSEHISHVYLPKILSISSKMPNIQLDVKIGLNQKLFSDLNDGMLDIALLVCEQGAHSKKVVGQFEVFWASSPETYSKKDHKALPIILYDGPCMFRTMMISTLEAHNIQWEVVYNASSIGDLKAAIEAKIGISALLSCEIDGYLNEGKPQCSNLPKLPKVDVVLHSRTYGKDPVITDIIDALNKYVFI